MKRFGLALVACIATLPALAGEVTFTEVHYAGDDGGPADARTQYRNPVVAGFYPGSFRRSDLPVPVWWDIGGVIDQVTGDQKDLSTDQPDRQCSR